MPGTLTAPTARAVPASAPAPATPPDPYRDAVLGVDGYANLDYAASAPALESVAARVVDVCAEPAG